MAIMARVTWGCEPDEVSMLHAVRYVKAAGGIGPMLDVEGGAQQDRFPAGTQQIALRMAEELGDRVTLGAVVERIVRADDGTVAVHIVGRCDARQGGGGGHPAAAPPRDRLRTRTARRVFAAGRALAAGQSQQGVRRLRHPVLAGRRPFG